MILVYRSWVKRSAVVSFWLLLGLMWGGVLQKDGLGSQVVGGLGVIASLVGVVRVARSGVVVGPRGIVVRRVFRPVLRIPLEEYAGLSIEQPIAYETWLVVHTSRREHLVPLVAPSVREKERWHQEILTYRRAARSVE